MRNIINNSFRTQAVPEAGSVSLEAGKLRDETIDRILLEECIMEEVIIISVILSSLPMQQL